MVAYGSPRAVIRTITGPFLPLMADAAALAEENARLRANLANTEVALVEAQESQRRLENTVRELRRCTCRPALRRLSLRQVRYQAYNALAAQARPEEPWLLVHCWMHVRRRFVKRLETDASPIAEEALRKIAQLYAIEAAVRGVSPGPSEDDLLG